MNKQTFRVKAFFTFAINFAFTSSQKEKFKLPLTMKRKRCNLCLKYEDAKVMIILNLLTQNYTIIENNKILLINLSIPN